MPLIFAAVTSACLVVGAIVGSLWEPPKAFTAAILAFAAGALTAALSFELFEESFSRGGHLPAALGLAGGALVFVVIDRVIERHRGSKKGNPTGLALLLSVMLDGVPENLALGTTLAAQGGSVALLVAICVSNFPEALVGSRGMKEDGESTRRVVGTWAVGAVLLALAIIAGSSMMQGANEGTLSVVLAFAGGAVLASLADTLFPEAFKDGGPWVAMATVAGFLCAFILGSIG